MQRGFRTPLVLAIVAAGAFAVRADVPPSAQNAQIEIQLGDQLFDEGRYGEALDAYQLASGTNDAGVANKARSGVIQAALREIGRAHV